MLNNIRAVILGHAIGDALGVPVEFKSRETIKKKPVTDMIGYGTYGMPAGTWSDDTSMTLCALESLRNNKVDYDDIMNNFKKWYYNEDFTATGVVFDIGIASRKAINNYVYHNCSTDNCGCSDVMSNGNGSLMRIHPFVLYAYYNGIEDDDFVDIIAKASALTHAHQCSIDGCVIYAYVLKELLDNPTKSSVYNGLNKAKNKINTSYYTRLLADDIGKFDKSAIKSSGYIVDSLEAAIWCLLTTESYSECVLKAVNLGDDTDTVAAIAGGLAGALYGIDAIPHKWKDTLKRVSYIENMCNEAYEAWSCNE